MGSPQWSNPNPTVFTSFGRVHLFQAMQTTVPLWVLLEHPLVTAGLSHVVDVPTQGNRNKTGGATISA